MTFRSVPMVYHPEGIADDEYPKWPEGHFGFVPDCSHIGLFLPHAEGHRNFVLLPIDGSRGWKWDGNREKPTITPSIFNDPNSPSSPYHWHGFVTNGQMVGV